MHQYVPVAGQNVGYPFIAVVQIRTDVVLVLAYVYELMLLNLVKVLDFLAQFVFVELFVIQNR